MEVIIFLIYGVHTETNKMSQIDIVVLPTLYVCAIVTGFLMNTCSKRKIIEKLEDENSSLEWENSILVKRLQDAEKRLKMIAEQVSDSTDS